MKNLVPSAICLLIALSLCGRASALIIPFGPDESAEAGEGCVGGFVSSHGTTSYYQGDTERLNQYLKNLVQSKTPNVEYHIRLRKYHLTIEQPLEAPILSETKIDKLAVAWSTHKQEVRPELPKRPFQVPQLKFNWSVPTVPLPQPVSTITVDVWKCDTIDFNAIVVPPEFSIKSDL